MHPSGSNSPLLPERDPTLSTDVAIRTIKKLDKRLLLLLSGMVFLAFVDRSNIGYAARDLCNELNLTHEEYGLGVSVFYGGYLSSQVVGNVILKRVGAPVWMSLIMFVWGCVATSLGFIQNAAQFYSLRVILGIAEGGTFPAIFHFLSLFYPPDYVSGAYSVVIAAISFSMPLSSPVSAALLALGDYIGVEGWRLLFIGEGLMPIAYAALLYVFLAESPEASTFLEPEEKAWIASEMESQSRASSDTLLAQIRTVLRTVRWWLSTTVCFLVFGISVLLMSWATLIVHDVLYGEDDDDEEDDKTCGSEEGNSAVSVLITAIPYLFSGLMCLAVKFYGITNRPRFVFWVTAAGGILLIIWSVAREISPFLGFVLLTASIASGFITLGPVTSLALEAFDSSTHSMASSLYNMFNSTSGIIFPPIIGRLIDDFGYGVAVAVSGGICVFAAILMLFVPETAVKQETEKNPHQANGLQPDNP